MWSGYGDTRELYDLERDPGQLVNVVRHHPELAQGWLRYNHALVRGDFPTKLREIVILRVAHRYQPEYERDQHVLIAGAISLGSNISRQSSRDPMGPYGLICSAFASMRPTSSA